MATAFQNARACIEAPGLSRRQQRPQVPRTLRRAELPQRLGLDLANALARDVELLADLLERVLALAADTEPQPDYLLLLGRKRLEDIGGLVADVGVDHRIRPRARPTVLAQVAQRPLAVPAPP